MNLHIQKNGKSSKGFYIALGVCLIAVGVAAWTTYDSVVNYSTPQDHSQSEAAKTNNNVSGIFVADSSSPAKTAPSSAAPAASSRARAVSSRPAKKASAKVLTFTYPAGRTILQKFSEKAVFNKTMQDFRPHDGIDLSAKTGEPVKACADGTVKNVYDDDHFGNTAVILHGEYEIRYCGLNKIDVKKDDSVTQGHEIGTVGSIPDETAEEPHLHLVVMKNGQAVDPLTVLE